MTVTLLDKWRFARALVAEEGLTPSARLVGFALLGMAFVGYGFVRERMVERAIARGEYVRPDERLLGVLTAVGILLGFALLVIVVVVE